ncbi:MAG: hypothetical protein A2W05_07020 [Candidatus Schekmanbacteria bacterium RBG_16_38_10]|uniref:Pyridoxamine 5'-phosphate oxidase N-terminal domain-containing protein n=1 Tax=Candidatus Schekmanbacteria bacterium RBG_16_38_10 TaxID=1817879 RepID=A0A1F7RYK2_9BACT|nr:MAG: hypothetical protein A2W05_07020 [Candidatus Schekmanbacteria bacterium RBG_16_38_10]
MASDDNKRVGFNKEQQVNRPRVAKLLKWEAEKAVAEYLAKHHFLVLGTCEDNIPRTTVLAYASRGTTIYVFTGYTKTVKSIETNPNVSLGIYTELPYHPVQGVNYRGRAEILRQNNPEFVEGWKVFCENPTLSREEPWANMEFLKKMPRGALLLKIIADNVALHDQSREDALVVVWSKED